MALFALAGCASLGRYQRGGASVAPLAVRAVDWNSARAALGRVSAVSDGGDVVVALGSVGATVLRAGAVAAVDGAVLSWTGAGNVPAADGSGRWLIGIDGDGGLRRLRGGAREESVAARYGLVGERVRAVAAASDHVTALLLERTLALADGARIVRFPLGDTRDLAAGGGRAGTIALNEKGAIGVRVVAFGNGPDGIDHATVAWFPLAGVRAIAIDQSGRLVAATTRAIYSEDAEGALRIRYVAKADTLHGLATSGSRVWFADGANLGLIEGGKVAVTASALPGRIHPSSSLVGSPTGDVWVLDDGVLWRFASDDHAGDPGAIDPLATPSAPASATDSWRQSVQPIFGRACASCHLPDGPSGVDLSNAAAWHDELSDLRQRLLVERSMPPRGHALADSDREALRRWLDHAGR